jgi:flagellar biosynthesis protein
MAEKKPNPLKEILKACALEYKGDGAPTVRAYAEGDAARRMVEVARGHGVEIKPDQEEALLLALKSVKVNTEIPREIYLAVARIYAYLLREGKKQAG